jgi:hypothetical protein
MVDKTPSIQQLCFRQKAVRNDAFEPRKCTHGAHKMSRSCHAQKQALEQSPLLIMNGSGSVHQLSSMDMLLMR